MIIHKDDAPTRPIDRCHDGEGLLHMTEMLGEYKRQAGGVKFIHDNIVEPGASIGEHTHTDDEEVYLIIDGRGTMRVDGVEERVGPGDICLTRPGHSHSLTNSDDGPMHLIVIGLNVQPQSV